MTGPYRTNYNPPRHGPVLDLVNPGPGSARPAPLSPAVSNVPASGLIGRAMDRIEADAARVEIWDETLEYMARSYLRQARSHLSFAGVMKPGWARVALQHRANALIRQARAHLSEKSR